MKVIVCGGRDYDNYDIVCEVLDRVQRERGFTAVVQGGAKGADMLGKRWAIENNYPYEEYTANWSLYGKAAGVLRNQEMLEESGAQIVIAFPGGTGTYDMIKRARNKPGVELIVVSEKNDLD